jgi:hypothetical protein
MKPNTKLCKQLKCQHLKQKEISALGSQWASWYCDITDLDPGKMKECPLVPEDSRKCGQCRYWSNGNWGNGICTHSHLELDRAADHDACSHFEKREVKE